MRQTSVTGVLDFWRERGGGGVFTAREQIFRMGRICEEKIREYVWG